MSISTRLIIDRSMFQTDAKRAAIKAKVKDYITKRNLHESAGAGTSRAAQETNEAPDAAAAASPNAGALGGNDSIEA